jgi:adenine-specific DNA-methyltransferase
MIEDKLPKNDTVTQYHHGDSKNILKILLDDKNNRLFDLIITSPPYNTGKEYESSKSIEDYLEEQRIIIEQIVKLINPTGSICWQVGNYINNKTKEVFPLDIYYYKIFKEYGLTLRNRIIWKFGHGLHTSRRFSGRYEVILWFTKSNEPEGYKFNLDTIRIPQKYPGKKQHKGPNKGQYSSNPKGKNPEDVWNIVLQDWEEEIWDIPNVKANHSEKTEHPCQYPIELVERCILALTDQNDWILDPFAGVGSTLIASKKNKRNSVGIEKYKKYIKIGQGRLNKLEAGILNIRPLGKPIYDHKKSNLSQIPIEFIKENESN